MIAVGALMQHEWRWTEADKAEEQVRAAYADARLDAWARWCRSHGIRIGFPGVSTFVKAMDPPEESEQIGARHLSVVATDDEAMQVDLIIARWRLLGNRRYCKLIDVEYFTSGPSEVKARRLGLSRLDYRHRLKFIQLLVADELDSGARDRA